MEYLEFEELPEGAYLQGVLRLHDEVFGSGQSARVLQEVAMRHGLFTVLAVEGEEVAGYKIGYERKPGHFYSWIGAVAPAFRKRGVGSELMRRQHAWCRARGYATIRTTTKNKWRDMIILNLRHGFDIIGAYTDEKGEPKLLRSAWSRRAVPSMKERQDWRGLKRDVLPIGTDGVFHSCSI